MCADKGDEQVELLQLDKSGIRVATYLTELPPKAVLQRRLHAAAQLARDKLAKPASEGNGSIPGPDETAPLTPASLWHPPSPSVAARGAHPVLAPRAATRSL